MKIRTDNILITLPFLGYILFLVTLPFSVAIASVFFFLTFIASVSAAIILFRHQELA